LSRCQPAAVEGEGDQLPFVAGFLDSTQAEALEADGVFNDDKYDYDTVGFPFLANLGKCLYDYEIARKRVHKPNLSKFATFQIPERR